MHSVIQLHWTEQKQVMLAFITTNARNTNRVLFLFSYLLKRQIFSEFIQLWQITFGGRDNSIIVQVVSAPDGQPTDGIKVHFLSFFIMDKTPFGTRDNSKIPKVPELLCALCFARENPATFADLCASTYGRLYIIDILDMTLIKPTYGAL